MPTPCHGRPSTAWVGGERGKPVSVRKPDCLDKPVSVRKPDYVDKPASVRKPDCVGKSFDMETELACSDPGTGSMLDMWRGRTQKCRSAENKIKKQTF